MKQVVLTISLALLLLNSIAQQRGGIGALTKTDSTGATRTTYALIVGISSYPYIKPLQYADKDAELFRDFLLSKAGGQVKPANITLLTNSTATSGNFQTAFQQLYTNKDIKKGDRVYIYFAGHGDAPQDVNEYYLLLHDCQPAGDANNYAANVSAVDMYHFKNRLGLLTKRGVEVVLILDACRTNELPGGYSSQAFNENITERKVGEIMMLATGPGEVSIESPLVGNGHGLFTFSLIDGLSGRADEEESGGDNNGEISLAEIQDWVRRNVRSLAQKQFHTQQNPFFCCSENEGTAIARVDSPFLRQWLTVKNDYSGYLNSVATRAVQTQRSATGGFDSTETALYNNFNNAVKQYRLWGLASANTYYDTLITKFPYSAYRQNAQFVLAAELLNFSQKKINLYLAGRDNDNTLALLKKQVSEPGVAAFTKENFYKDSAIMVTGFYTTGLMMQKAAKLLSESDSSFEPQTRGKINFLFARAFYSDEYNTTGKISSAEAMQYAYMALNADSNAAYTNHAVALFYDKIKMYNEAIRFERRAIALAPKWAYAYNHLGLIYYTQGNVDSAWHYYTKAIAVDSNYTDPYLNMAVIASQKTIHNKPNKYYQKYFKLPALEAGMLVAYGNTLYDMEKYQAAIWFFNQVLKTGTQTDTAYFNIGNSWRALGDTAQAIAAYKKAIIITSSFSDAYLNIGSVYADSLNLGLAKYYFKMAIATNSNNAIAFFNMGNLFLKMNMDDSACAYYKKTLSVDPAYADAWLNMGISLASDKKYSEALACYTKAIQLDSHFTKAYIAAGNVYKDINQPDSAIYYYKLAAIQPPGTPPALDALANTYIDLHKNDSALLYLKQALTLFPGNAALNYETGNCFAAMNIKDSAIVYYEKAIKLYPAYADAYYNLACVYSTENDSKNALLFLEKALKAGLNTTAKDIQNDADLLNIKNAEGFKKLLEKYFK